MALGLGIDTVNGSSGTSVVTSSVTTTAGSTIIVGFRFFGTFTSVTDSKGNTWTQIGTQLSLSDGTEFRVYYNDNNGASAGLRGSSHTFTGTAGSAYCSIIVVEGTGTSASPSLDVAGRQEDSASPFTSPGVATTVADTFLVSFVFMPDGTNPTTTVASPFTKLSEWNQTSGDGLNAASAYRIVSATGTYNSSWTATAGTSAGVTISAHKVAAGGATQAWAPRSIFYNKIRRPGSLG